MNNPDEASPAPVSAHVAPRSAAALIAVLGPARGLPDPRYPEVHAREDGDSEDTIPYHVRFPSP